MSLHQQPHKFESSSKEVQVVFGGVYIAKTRSPLLVWEQPNKPPVYYIPQNALLSNGVTVEPKNTDSNGDRHRVIDGRDDEDDKQFELTVGGKHTTITVYRTGDLKGYVRLEFADMDAWLENGVLTRLPPRNPSRRIDTAVTSAHITVTAGDTLVADASHAVILFETGLPPRYYLPATGVVNWRNLKAREKVTACPYKGEARYFDIVINEEVWEDAVWYYMYPVSESAAIAGRLAFVTGRKGIRVAVDGVELES